MNVDDVVAVSTPLYFVLIGLEMLLSYLKKKKYYTLPDTATNVYLMLLNMGLDVLFMVVTLTVLGFFYQYRLFVIEPPVLYWIALFFAEDFAFYWLHRIDHSSRFLWAVHVTHHSSSYFNLTTGFRSSVFQPLYRFLYFIPLALMGFRAVDIFLMYAITQIYGILVHTNFIGKLGFLEKIMVTPSLHRVHHATNIPYLDKNLGMVLIIWDKLFGTYAEEDENEPIAFGLYEKEIKRDPFNVVFHEWRSIFHDMKKVKTWRTKWKYFFMPPGWSHDGSTKTSKELQREFSKHKPS